MRRRSTRAQIEADGWPGSWAFKDCYRKLLCPKGTLITRLGHLDWVYKPLLLYNPTEIAFISYGERWIRLRLRSMR